ncbi:hypothetical protein [Flagellimonas meridianipacifica]|uniref:Uncharacterized protein n=1 Tax=Flagellimonas meridianipacifica TaxID=1080225 RepID=A0A2T0MD02_9FLAO|nr:hypothetical protein [Allomuricauda pacifica]PRX55365.1 hypothetical protein CLV81_3774 [Allomuricauda pacifica]
MKKLRNTLIVWVSIYPAISIFLMLFGEVLDGLPVLLRTLILTLVLVPLMVYVLIPFWTGVFEKFKNRRARTLKYRFMNKIIIVTVLYMVVSVVIMITTYGLIISSSKKGEPPVRGMVLENNRSFVQESSTSQQLQENLTLR